MTSKHKADRYALRFTLFSLVVIPAINLCNWSARIDKHELDTDYYHNWKHADSLYGKDKRYTDQWCDEAIK